MAGESILIVDDSEEIISFLIAVLQPLGYVVSYALDGKTGLTKAIYEKPDLVLLDLNLPGMSGMAVLEALFQRQVRAPVIMMTFHGSESVVSRALRLGARDYLVKPFEIDDILGSIERVLGTERERHGPDDLFAMDLSEIYTQPQSTIDAATFQSLISELPAATSMPAFLSQATQVALQIAGADVCAIFLRDDNRSALKITAIRQGKGYRSDVNVNDTHAEGVMRSGQALHVAAATTSASFAAQLNITADTLFYAPITLRERVVGVVGLAYFQRGQELSLDVQNWVATLCDYFAILLENVRFRDVLHHSVPLQKVYDVLGVLVRTMVKSVQALSKLVDDSRALPNSVGEALAHEVRIVTIILAVFKDVASPKSAIYIGSAHVTDIEKELDIRLAKEAP